MKRCCGACARARSAPKRQAQQQRRHAAVRALGGAAASSEHSRARTCVLHVRTIIESSPRRASSLLSLPATRPAAVVYSMRAESSRAPRSAVDGRQRDGFEKMDMIDFSSSMTSFSITFSTFSITWRPADEQHASRQRGNTARHGERGGRANGDLPKEVRRGRNRGGTTRRGEGRRSVRNSRDPRAPLRPRATRRRRRPAAAETHRDLVLDRALGRLLKLGELFGELGLGLGQLGLGADQPLLARGEPAARRRAQHGQVRLQRALRRLEQLARVPLAQRDFLARRLLAARVVARLELQGGDERARPPTYPSVRL